VTARLTPTPRSLPRVADVAVSHLRRLLVVDDSALVGRALARTARALGWDVDVAATWEKGQRLVQSRQYHVALVDFGLGGPVTGIQILAWLRAVLPEVRVVLMSGAEPATLGLRCPDCPFLLKPFGREQLAAALAAVVGEA
jgi:DNA-binding response OmpR family regulator